MFDLLVLHYFKVLSTDLAVDGVAEVLLGHPDQAAADQDCHGDPVVQLEDHIVDGQVVGLEDSLGRPQQVQGHCHLRPLRLLCHLFIKIVIISIT